MMKARSNKPYPITAFGGLEYVVYEWRPVPPGNIQEALANPYLEIAEPDATEAAVLLAEEHGVNLYNVSGSGADGRILKTDVEATIT